MDISYYIKTHWPPLAWIASFQPGNATIEVYHGSSVEIKEDWFCEATWNGDFEEGDFDKTDIIAGSGGRKREDKFIFVSAGNTVDRLVSIQLDDVTLVSNSLPCLAAMAGFDFIVDHDWYAAFHSIVKGIKDYQHEIPCSAGKVILTYFNNLIWDGDKLKLIEKPIPYRNFSSYELYYDFLLKTLQVIRLNGLSQHRQQPFQLLTTLSTGYDSSAVSALAKKVDSKIEGFTFTKNSPGLWNDAGDEIAKYLQIKLHTFSINEWKNCEFSEIPHIAADCLGTEIQYTSAAPVTSARILLTGFHGDVIWSKDLEGASEQIVRGDQSGLSLSEYRLWANFLHCPIPFWGARQSADIIRISNQPDMKEWDIPGDYSRPICRRIVETAGVPRELFGKKKKAASNSLYAYEQFLPTSQSMQCYLGWLRSNRLKLIKSPFSNFIISRKIDHIFFKAFKLAQHIAGKLGSIVYSIKALNRLRNYLYRIETLDWANNVQPPWVLPLRRFLFPWAVDMAKKKYVTSNNNQD